MARLPSLRAAPPRLLALWCALALAGCSKPAAPEGAGAKAPAPRAAPEVPLPTIKTYKTYRDPQGLFSCEVPSAWPRSVDEGTQTRNVSFMLRLPRPDDPKRASVFSLSVYYYAPGGEFSSADEFVRRNTLSLGGAEAGPVLDARLKAGPAKRWAMTLPSVGFPEALDAGKMKESLAVLRAGKGFFVLSYSSPEELHPAHLAHFERMLETFLPSQP